MVLGTEDKLHKLTVKNESVTCTDVINIKAGKSNLESDLRLKYLRYDDVKINNQFVDYYSSSERKRAEVIINKAGKWDEGEFLTLQMQIQKRTKLLQKQQEFLKISHTSDKALKLKTENDKDRYPQALHILLRNRTQHSERSEVDPSSVNINKNTKKLAIIKENLLKYKERALQEANAANSYDTTNQNLNYHYLLERIADFEVALAAEASDIIKSKDEPCSTFNSLPGNYKKKGYRANCEKHCIHIKRFKSG